MLILCHPNYTELYPNTHTHTIPKHTYTHTIPKHTHTHYTQTHTHTDLHELVDLVPGGGDGCVLAADAVVHIGHDQQVPAAAALPGDEGSMAEHSHQPLQRVEVGLAALH